jgi:hypothetical protein
MPLAYQYVATIQNEEEEELLCFTVVKKERYAIGIPVHSPIQMEKEEEVLLAPLW